MHTFNVVVIPAKAGVQENRMTAGFPPTLE